MRNPSMKATFTLFNSTAKTSQVLVPIRRRLQRRPAAVRSADPPPSAALAHASAAVCLTGSCFCRGPVMSTASPPSHAAAPQVFPAARRLPPRHSPRPSAVLRLSTAPAAGDPSSTCAAVGLKRQECGLYRRGVLIQAYADSPRQIYFP
ncbi:hypothetical protein GUJ93_ZPchr0010g8448 [Zizania palustris]|uniref:Uncharacterized protein n=1 Tax=Zizania palustris TaxID=103762 RepID=A0A8J6BBH0_ZIZPA|nr:hypothetical protein GUJ93_ZPchr0010g8448 [Zizania palustris]